MNETLDRLIDALEPVADKLGQGAEHVYRLAVRDALITGVNHTLVGLLFFAVAFAFLRLARSWHKKAEALEQAYEDAKAELKRKEEANPGSYQGMVHRSDYRPTDEGQWKWGCYAVAAVSVLVGLIFAQNAVYYLINPEYQAIQSLLESVRG